MSQEVAYGTMTYLEIPANDPARSADFYRNVFGWNIRRRRGGVTAFDDSSGHISGAWIRARPVSRAPGLLIYLWVDNVAAALESVVAHDGSVVQPIGVDAPEITARFADPAGNVLGLYQDPDSDA